ncbi:hypothetical protein J2S55_007855 [Streptosporangium brasiliense]|uniref:Uncharacterized protein n=1 Tax=Streptosporangium brasiliense TaxID=47480 RepID=A0ABT9RH45_9ACTN|nr:hypothetical protein [Streptosporangium brasiliense]
MRPGEVRYRLTRALSPPPEKVLNTSVGKTARRAVSG